MWLYEGIVKALTKLRCCKGKWPLMIKSKVLFSFLHSCFNRDCVPCVLVSSIVWALHHRSPFLSGWCLRLQKGLAVCWRLLVLLSLLDIASPPRLEQLWTRGSWYHLLRPVAPPLTLQHLVCVVSLHLLSAAAPSAHAIFLWKNPDGHKEGEFRDTWRVSPHLLGRSHKTKRKPCNHVQCYHVIFSCLYMCK